MIVENGRFPAFPAEVLRMVDEGMRVAVHVLWITESCNRSIKKLMNAAVLHRTFACFCVFCGATTLLVPP